MCSVLMTRVHASVTDVSMCSGTGWGVRQESCLRVGGAGGYVMQRLLLALGLVLVVHGLVGVGVDGSPAPGLVVIKLMG